MSGDHDLGPKPDPEIEPGESNPGGADAINDGDGVEGHVSEEPDTDPLARDLDPDHNPAVEEALPEEMKQTEDTDTKATKADKSDDDSDDSGDDDEDDIAPEEESPA